MQLLVSNTQRRIFNTLYLVYLFTVKIEWVFSSCTPLMKVFKITILSLKKGDFQIIYFESFLE